MDGMAHNGTHGHASIMPLAYSPEYWFEATTDGTNATITGFSGAQPTNTTVISIPATFGGFPVREIRFVAFDNQGLIGVTIPDSVTTIGQSAFANNQLSEIIIPDSVTVIEGSAFRGNQLSEVIIPNSVTYIGEFVFANNHLIEVNIPNSVTDIGEGAFENNQLTKVTIGNSVTHIGVTAFAHNHNLASVYFLSSTAPTFVHSTAFAGIAPGARAIVPYGATGFGNVGELWNGLLVTTGYFTHTVNVSGGYATITGFSTARPVGYTDITIPHSMGGFPVRAIYWNAFNGQGLTGVTIPNSVTTIGVAAFQNNQLTEVIIPNSVTTIGVAAFQNNQLTEVIIPNSVTLIGNNAFMNNQLSEVAISNNVTIISPAVFMNNQLTEVTIPNSVTDITQLAFVNNPNLQNVYFLSSTAPNVNFEPFADIAPGARAIVPSGTTTFGGVPVGGLWNGLIVTAFVAVTNITGVPTAGTAGTPMTLTGAVEPSNATRQTIVWSVVNAGATGATIAGNVLNTTAAGTVTVRATVAYGAAIGAAFTQDFSIVVSAAGGGSNQGDTDTGIVADDVDYGPADAWITPNRADFDLYNPSDVVVTLNRGDFAFRNVVRFGTENLVLGRDFSVNSDRITIYADFLATLGIGTRRLTFEMNGGYNPQLTINVADSTPMEVEEEAVEAAMPMPFVDVSPTDWFYPFVRAVWEAQLFSGTSATTFEPQGSMTRAMFVQVLANLEGVDLTAYGTQTQFHFPTFGDVAPLAWYAPAIEWAAAQGLVSGMGDGNFAPSRAITRQEMAVMLNNFIVSRGIVLPQGETGIFTDHDDISDWALEGVLAIQAAGIIAGYPDGSFAPTDTATRAEVATIFARFLEVADLPRRENLDEVDE